MRPLFPDTPAVFAAPRREEAARALIGRREWLGAGALTLASLALGDCAPSIPPARAAQSARLPAGVVHLDLNENPFGPSPLVADAVRGGLVDLARYTGPEADALQREIAAIEHVASEQIVLGDVLEAIAVHLALAGGPGGEFVYSNPGYAAFADTAASAGGIPVPVPLDAHLANDLTALSGRLGDRTRALFLVNPHNPSGTVSDPDSMKAFVRAASARSLVLVDEAYIEFTDDPGSRSCVDLVRSGSQVAVFRTFSKAYGLAALPLGYAVTPRDLADRLRSKGVGHPRSLNRLAVLAAAATLRDPGYIESVRAKVAAERAIWYATLSDLGLRAADSHANFVFFETGRPHDAFAAAMLAGGVDIGRSFRPLDRWARISIGLPEENVRAREVLRRVLR
jgi:histidinol-phosphate aminotransferase